MNDLLQVLYVIVGIILLFCAIEAFRDKKNPTHVGTAIFWLIMAITFAFGNVLPSIVIGILIVLMGVLALFKQLKVGNIPEVDEKKAEAGAKRFGWKIFIPSIVLAVIAFCISQYTKLGGQIAIGIASIVSLIVAWIETRSSAKDVYFDTHRSVRAVGTAGVLPQLLAMLGVVFTASGVGTLTARIIAGIFPAGNHLLGCAVYVIAMAVFTMIMGNAFGGLCRDHRCRWDSVRRCPGWEPCRGSRSRDDRWLLWDPAHPNGGQLQQSASGPLGNQGRDGGH